MFASGDANATNERKEHFLLCEGALFCFLDVAAVSYRVAEFFSRQNPQMNADKR
jgi:hypothetical protein